MKTRSILAVLLLMMAGLQTMWAQKMVVTMADDSKVVYDIMQVKDITFEEAEEPEEQYEWVDLGLPSGTLWATCNVGASSPEEYGDYFAWGETEPKSSYTWGTYKWMNVGYSDYAHINKYTCADYNKSACWYDGNRNFIGDGKIELDPADDAATANWGSGWQMPSLVQCQELINSEYTTTTWTTQNGINGRKITSKSNGNSIFLPAAGYRFDKDLSLVGSYGRYWSRSLSPDSQFGYGLDFNYSSINMNYDYHFSRYEGLSVRPVRVQNTLPVQLVTSIVLSETSLILQLNENKVLIATVFPEDADNPVVTWKSSDTNVAEVNETGRVISNNIGTCVITCSATDGSGVKAECQVTVTPGTTPDPGGHAWVDLDLPSGTLWATCNVGASSPEEYGDYFAWGETKPKTTYNWDTYFDTEDGGITFKKYNNNGGLTELLPEDDAATANWGSGWRMPSLDQIKELYNSSYTKTEWTQVNGVNGRKITSISNGNSIFLPAAGSRWDDELYHAGSRGYSWSSSLDPSFDYYADFVYFSSSRWYWRNDWARGYGHSVRAVRP